jgi:SAM-dependent methyltransferase
VAQRLDDKTKAVLTAYLKDIRSLPNESAKTHRFAALIGELFPATPVTMAFAASIEKLVRIDTSRGPKRGRIDSYYGNAVIEFENSLRATGAEAERQLREYVAGVWSKEGTSRPLIALASDGIAWKTYLPRLVPGRQPKPEHVELEELRTLVVSEPTLADFWLWLTSLLFRPQSIPPTIEQFQIDFGATSPAFRDGMDALRIAWASVGASEEQRLAFETWQKYLTVTYGSISTGPSLELLFLKHTYLASVARLLLWASFSRGKVSGSLREVAAEVLSGEFFRAQQLANLVEEDFFQWVLRPEAEQILAPIWERVLDQMVTYDLGHIGEDVLKGVYQELVDPADRHDLGEYYTPDWLCDRIVSKLLPDTGLVSVLDPACGSGSFLRAAIAHLAKVNAEGSANQRLQAILAHVVGIDIHPLAVTISRATYLLALGALVKASRRPIQIPVYLADSLFLPTEVQQMSIGDVPGLEVRFGNRKVTIPDSLVEAPELFDGAIAACTRVALSHARSKGETQGTLGAYLSKEVPALAELKGPEHVFAALWRFTDELAALIRTKKNSIWAFIVRNGYRPAMLRGRFDVIVGNPPWLSYRFIADPDYQAEVKQRAITQYRIAPKSQKLFTQMELATVFLAHALTVFGRKHAKLGFVMPRSVLAADQHVNLRTRSYSAPFRLTSYWDLRDVRPLFKVPACVLFARREELSPDSVKDALKVELPVQEWEGHLPSRDVPWATAREHLTTTKATGRLVFLGKDRTAFSTTGSSQHSRESSHYASRFRQGATIVPRSFYFVAVRGLTPPPDPDGLYWAETDPEQAKDAKQPYRDVRIRGEVEGRFLFSTAISRHLLPFAILPSATVVLPLEHQGGSLRVRTAKELQQGGYRETAAWMERAERIWKKARGPKAQQQSVYEWLDYQKKLTAQDLSVRHLVVYNHSGKNVAAAYLDRESLPLPFVVDVKLYWGACETRTEADYLVAFLNSERVNQLIKPFQSLGLKGERDIHKKVLDLPIPRYDPTSERHVMLSNLGSEARKRANEVITSTELPRSLAARRSWMRGRLRDLLDQIDKLAKILL